MPYTEQQVGYQNSPTSEDAARSMSDLVPGLRGTILKVLQRNPGGMTPDEVAAEIGETAFTVRPRVTELYQGGLIIQTGERRKNASGRFAAVYACR